MAAPQVVNAQITDALTETLVTILGESAAQALGMLYQSQGHATGLAMHNAVHTQHGMQNIGEAAVAAACARLLSIQGPMPPPKNGSTTNGSGDDSNGDGDVKQVTDQSRGPASPPVSPALPPVNAAPNPVH